MNRFGKLIEEMKRLADDEQLIEKKEEKGKSARAKDVSKKTGIRQPYSSDPTPIEEPWCETDTPA